MQLTPRPIVYLGFAVIAGALAIAATTVPVVRHTPAPTSGTVALRSVSTLWRTCVEIEVTGRPTVKQCRKVDEYPNNCGIVDRYRAMRAFCISAILVCFLAAVPLGVIDLLNVTAMTTGVRKIAMAIVGAATAALALVVWAIWSDTWTTSCNGALAPKEVNGTKWGPMAPLMIAVSVLGALLVIVALVVPGARKDAAGSASAPDDGNEGPAPHAKA